MWCIAEKTPEYVDRMEEVLDLYEKPLDVKEPVVCLDERPVQLLGEVREPIVADKPGKILKQDSEYIRCGTANVFCAVEPKKGRHFTKVTPNRKGTEFAMMARDIARAYPRAETIHLVMDNLNTHCEKSLTANLGEKRGQKLWQRFTVHYTPKHGSWLNQAEIEIGLFSRQCLGWDRVSNRGVLGRRAMAWNRRVNRRKLKINWRFTVKDARRTLTYIGTPFKRSEH